MRPIAVLAGAVSLVALSSCGWIEESKAAAKRDAAGLRVIEAIEAGDLGTVKEILGKDPQAANSFRWTKGTRRGSMRYRSDTPLTVAAKARNAAAVDLLLAAGADPNLALDSGDVPLDVLVRVEPCDATSLGLAKTLASHGARLGPRRLDRDRETTSPLVSLLRARFVKEGETELLRFLASDAEALRATDLRGRTPLHNAAAGCQDRAVEVLLEAGADPNARALPSREKFPTQRAGDTPLHAAADCGRLDVAFVLCAGGSNPHLKNDAGETPRDAVRRMTADDPNRTGNAASPRLHESVVAAFAPGGPCETWYGRFLREGRPATWEPVRAARYELGCVFDDRYDCHEAGWAFHKGEGVGVDFGKAMAAYRKACGLKDAWACGMVGALFDAGSGVEENPAEASRWFTTGCDGGDGQSCYRLGVLARDGRGAVLDRSRALALFETSCAKKFERGCEAARAIR